MTLRAYYEINTAIILPPASSSSLIPEPIVTREVMYAVGWKDGTLKTIILMWDSQFRALLIVYELVIAFALIRVELERMKELN